MPPQQRRVGRRTAPGRSAFRAPARAAVPTMPRGVRQPRKASPHAARPAPRCLYPVLRNLEWTSALLREVLDRDIVALLPDDELFEVFEDGFVDSEPRSTRADGVFSIRLTDGRKLYATIEHKR